MNKEELIKKLEDIEWEDFEVKEAKLMTAPLDVLKDSKFKNFMLKTVFKRQLTKNPFLATNVFVYAEKPI